MACLKKCYGPDKKIIFKKPLFELEVKGQGSHEGSPKLQSLLDLQNPNTFTLGMDGGKKQITKASFMDNTSSLSDNMDTNDPLGSLGPLWTMKK